MAAKARYYSVFQQKPTVFHSLRHYRGIKQKRSILASIIASYLLLGVFTMYSLATGVFAARSQAAELPLELTTSMQLINENSYALGDTISADLTIQNPSSTQNAERVVASLLSTNNSVQWKNGVSKTMRGSSKVITITDNTLDIGMVEASDRTTIHLTGTLNDTKFPYLALLARLTYINQNGTVFSASSNKTYTKLNNTLGAQTSQLTLTATKPNYDFGEDISLELAYGQGDTTQIAPEIHGTITVTDIQGQTVGEAQCDLGATNSCSKVFQNLPVGSFTALFISEDNQTFSKIAAFTVAGQKSQFAPSPLANLFLPFGANSINGYVPVHATSVIDQNTDIAGKECTFEVLASGNDQPIFSINAAVASDRSCAANLKLSDVKVAGQYTIRLARSSFSTLAYFSEAPLSYLPLSLPLIANTPGREVTISSSEVTSAADATIKSNANIQIGIFHYRSGEYTLLGDADTTFKYTNGNFEVNLPSRYFQKGGFYQLFLKATELDKANNKVVRYSDFVGFSYDVASTSLSAQGIVVPNYDSLVAGGAFSVVLSGITNGSDSVQTSGECLATLYAPGAPAISVSGAIDQGNCNVQIGEGKLTKVGPTLVTFVSDTKDKSIPQSRIIDIRANTPTKYGVLVLEREPANRGYANRAIIGPVVDAFGNLASSTGMRLQVSDLADNSIVYSTPVSIQDGFANPIIPAQIFTTPKLKLELVDASAQVMLSREIEVSEQNYDFVPAQFEKSIRSDDSISIKTQIPLAGDSKVCALTIVQGGDADPTIPGVINEENGACSIDGKPEMARNQKQLLYKIVTGDQTVYSLVAQKPSEPKSPFVVVPAIRTSAQDEVELSLLTSPIVDAAGMLTNNIKMNLEYNAKSLETDVIQGIAKVTLHADEINARSIKTLGQSRYLDIDVNAKTSTQSIAKPTNIRVSVTAKDIAKNAASFEIVRAQNRVQSGSDITFVFRTEACTARIIGDRGQRPLQAHLHGQNCYIQTQAATGKNTILFEKSGFEIGRFEFDGVVRAPQAVWCSASPCKNQVVTELSGTLEATLFDGVNEFRFKSDTLASLVTISQNGLGGLKDYLVQLKFVDADDITTIFYQRLNGGILK